MWFGKLERNKYAVRIVGLVVCCCFFITVHAQNNKYSANINPVLGTPYSLFLSDYSTPGSNALSANIVFNDFGEPSWNFKLRIKIESSAIRMETVQGYRPQSPITVLPGVVKTFSGADWEEYFNYNNLNIAGVSVNQLIASGGRLPEGFYSFCFQVLDYDTGDPLSEEICRSVWLKLMDSPRLNLPSCGNSLDPKLTQHPFTWQLFDTSSPNTSQPAEFQLTIWEVLDKGVNPQTAVANGQVLQIFQSAVLAQPAYSYSLSDPPLELGKQYVYRVQATDPQGRDKFKNQGYSEFCSFYYGWPANGKISLQFPVDGGGFRKKDIPYVKWSAVDTQLPGQKISYEVRVAPIIGDQEKEQAIQVNEPLFYTNTPATNLTNDRSQEIDTKLEVMTKYAWQVKAFTDQQEVGKSEVSYFNGPSLMEEFWANVHRVAVDYLDGTDLNDLSGGGRIRLVPDADTWTPVRFEHIQLQNMGDFYVMTGGEFFYEPKNLSIELTAAMEQNGAGYFDVKRFRVNKDGIYLEGNVRWPFPFATLSTDVPYLKSEVLWANYNNFTINTAARVAKGNQFKLLEPLNFILNLSPSSIIYIYNNEYRFDLNGLVELPDKIKGPVPGVVTFPFRKAEQLFYIDQDSLGSNQVIAPLARANFEVVTTRYTLDLSDEESPVKFKGNPQWKGVYLQDFDLKINTSFDGKGQFDMVEAFTSKMIQPATNETDAWLTASGLNLKFDLNLHDSIKMIFQTFPAYINRFRFEMEENQVVADNSYVKGNFIIPVISNDKKFLFTVPANNLGFQDGFLENLVNTKFTFNAGSGEQEVNLTIKRAVLSGYEKIGMTVDLEWPSIGVTLTDLRGFNAWGDYSIGFDNKNGTIPLTQRHNASLSGYPITIGVIGAGSNDGNYIFATTADAGLGDDVSGGSSVPSINVYSVSANKYVPAGASGQIVANPTQQIPFEQASANVSKDYNQLKDNLTKSVEADQEKLVNDAENLKNSLTSGKDEVYAAEDMVTSDGQPYPAEAGYGATPQNEKFNSRQQQIIYDIASGFVEEMAKPILDPIKSKTDSLNKAVEKTVNGLVDKASDGIKISVNTIVMGLADNIAKALDNDKVDVSGMITEMGRKTSERITLEITTSLQLTAKNNIIEPVNVLLKDQIQGRISKHITVNGTKAVYSAITGSGENPQKALEEMVRGIPLVADSIIKDVAAFVSVDHIRSTIEATAEGFIKNINMSEVGHDLRKDAEEIIKAQVNKMATEAVANLAEKYGAEVGLGGLAIGGENPINFVGVAQRFSKDGIKGVFAIDPVRVTLRTPVIDLDGFMSYTPKHPVYGNVWLGDIDMTIKAPKKFAFNAIYFNGRKDNVSYWFCQITPPGDSNTPYELGKPLSKAAKALKEPVNIGVMQIVGASGRLYHHMSETPGNGIVPDANMKYGAYMHFVFYDKKSEPGKMMRLELSGEINSKENGDYTVAFDGNLQLQSPEPKLMEIDKNAAVLGTVMIRYNSAEEHFLGYAKVIVNKPNQLCAQASLLVDVKPGHWRVAIGTREERIIFVPGCKGWSPTGWLDLNQSEAELGLGVQYSGAAKQGIDLKVVDIEIVVDAGFAFGIVAAVQYNPSFALLRAGVWVDIWANVIANYKFMFGKRHSITLVEIYIRGDLVIIFSPPPSMLKGDVNGHVSIVGFNINFKAHMEKNL